MNMYPVLADAKLDGQRVLLRAGFDVPMEHGEVRDASRIEAMIPTIQFLRDHGASVIILAHQGRPKGTVNPEYSQQPIVQELEKLLGTSVAFSPSCTGPETKQMVDDLAPGGVLLLENLRFDPREEMNDEGLAKELAAYGDLYVNDAFTNSHRAHASMDALPRLLPSYMGLQLEEELKHLSTVINNPTHPLCLIVSGAKVETKLPLIERFRLIGDDILPGGAIANTLLAAQGATIGVSLIDESFVDTAKAMLVPSADAAQIHFPTDAIVATGKDDQSEETVALNEIPADSAIFDLGPQTVAAYVDVINKSSTIVWNGPLGMFEQPRFAAASNAIAQAMAEATKRGAITIIGGGDTIDCVERAGFTPDNFTFISTAGGAMLDYLAGKDLPGLIALVHRA